MLLKMIEKEYGSLDDFVTSQPAYVIVEKLSNPISKYKLHNIGEALAWEYLRNVGIDGAKPDVHMCRFFGKGRIGGAKGELATSSEVYDIVKKLSSDTGYTMAAIDNIIWSYCSEGYGGICFLNPKCGLCVVKKWCNRGKEF